MTLTSKDLCAWEASTHTALTEQQRAAILDRFGAEPEPREWTQQDVYTQIRNYLAHGEFVKTMRDNSGGAFDLPTGVAF